MSEIFSHNIVDIVSGISPLGGLGGKKVTFSLFIGLYVKKELSVDKAFVNGEMIYRLEFEYPDRGKNAV